MLLLIANPNDSPMRRFADAPWLAKSGEKIWRLPFFYYFCMQITYYLDISHCTFY